MPRFVVLCHEPGPNSSSPRHWDFMLEHRGQLRTWGLTAEPDSGSKDAPIPARQLVDHRLAYLDYEGEISGGRGTVTRWDAGTFEVVSDSDQVLEVTLSGVRLRGAAILVRGESPPGDWGFSFLGQS